MAGILTPATIHLHAFFNFALHGPDFGSKWAPTKFMTHASCPCCARQAAAGLLPAAVTRREFLYQVGTLTVGGLALSTLGAAAATPSDQKTARGPLARLPLTVQPVLTYSIPTRQTATSWRSWGGIQTETDAAQEKERIGRELAKLAATADFPIEFLPVVALRNAEPAAALAKGRQDVTLMFAAGGGGNILQALTAPDKWNLMFLRHDPGPVYLWYEIVHPRFLRKTVMDLRDYLVRGLQGRPRGRPDRCDHHQFLHGNHHAHVRNHRLPPAEPAQ